VRCARGRWPKLRARRREKPTGPCVSAFAAIVPFAIFLVFFATFALQRDRILSHVDFDVVFRQTWQIRTNHKFIAALERFDLWRPEASAFASAPKRPRVACCKSEAARMAPYRVNGTTLFDGSVHRASRRIFVVALTWKPFNTRQAFASRSGLVRWETHQCFRAVPEESGSWAADRAKATAVRAEGSDPAAAQVSDAASEAEVMESTSAGRSIQRASNRPIGASGST
jgi:hypothetical protein